MTGLTNFLFSLVFSFVGSVPPGTINLMVIQLSFEKKISLALRFAFAAALIEYPYAWIAVKFERLITSSPVITENLQLIAATVMTLLGVINIWPSGNTSPSRIKMHFENSGFRKGIILGILNPLAIPYWIAMTAYLKSQNWIKFYSGGDLHAYLLGVFIGAFLLLIILAYFSKKAMTSFAHYPWIKKIPGYVLLFLGLFSFIRYFFLGD